MKLLPTVIALARAGLPTFDDAESVVQMEDNDTSFSKGKDAMLEAINVAIRKDFEEAGDRSETFDGVSALERAKRNQLIGVCGQSQVHSEVLKTAIDYSYEKRSNKSAEEPDDYKKYIYTGREKAEDGEFPFFTMNALRRGLNRSLWDYLVEDLQLGAKIRIFCLGLGSNIRISGS